MKTGLTVCILCAAAGWAGASESVQCVVQRIELTNPVHADRGPQTYEVVQMLDDAGRPCQYRMQLVTDVCLLGFCKLLKVTLVWDDQGNYLCIQTADDEPLTKNKHDPFTAEDYRQLDEILKNKCSVLGRYPLSEFVTTRDPARGLDARSGATLKSAVSEVVPGAVYSTWVLWRWVNGDIVDELKRLTAKGNRDA